MDTGISPISGAGLEAQSNPAEINSDKVLEAARQLHTAITRFSQEIQKNRESHEAQLSDQLRATDTRFQRVDKQIEKLESWFKYNRR
jgi:hypothetical protein